MAAGLSPVEYSKEFDQLVRRLHRGKENWPYYRRYLEAHLGGPKSRLVNFGNRTCREIELHCGAISGMRVLDFGCGTGASTAALALASAKVCAIDIDKESLDICRKRIAEHGLGDRVECILVSDLSEAADSVGPFDLVVANGVVEHIPLSKEGLRRSILRSLFELLRPAKCLFINDTPNRLWPFDFHSTHLWWIPWTKPGSVWAYRRAVRRGRHSEAPTISRGPLGLEEVGAWGATYWEILGYLREMGAECINLLPGHEAHIDYFRTEKEKAFYEPLEALLVPIAVTSLHAPITAFAPMLSNLVLRRRAR